MAQLTVSALRGEDRQTRTQTGRADRRADKTDGPTLPELRRSSLRITHCTFTRQTQLCLGFSHEVARPSRPLDLCHMRSTSFYSLVCCTSRYSPSTYNTHLTLPTHIIYCCGTFPVFFLQARVTDFTSVVCDYADCLTGLFVLVQCWCRIKRNTNDTYIV